MPSDDRSVIPGMPPRQKGPRGRPPGALNELTLQVRETLKSLDVDPVRGLALIASGQVTSTQLDKDGNQIEVQADLKVRAYCYAQLLPYVAVQIRDTQAAKSVAPSGDSYTVNNVMVSIDQRLAEYHKMQHKGGAAKVRTIDASEFPGG